MKNFLFLYFKLVVFFLRKNILELIGIQFSLLCIDIETEREFGNFGDFKADCGNRINNEIVTHLIR